MNDFLLMATICTVCYLFHSLLDYLSIKAYQRGYEIIGNILSFISIVFIVISAISFIVVIVVSVKLIV